MDNLYRTLKNSIIILGIILLFLISIQLTKAEEITLTLRESVAVALEKNETILQDAKNGLKASQLNLIIAHRYYRPQIDLDSEVDRTTSLNLIKTDNYTTGLNFIWPLLTFTGGTLTASSDYNLNYIHPIENDGFTSNVSTSLTLKQPLSRGGRLNETASLRLVKENHEKVKMEYKQALQGLILEVISNYYTLMRARFGVESATEQVDLTKKLLKWTEARLAVGQVADLDVMNVRVALATAEDNLTQAIDTEGKAKRSFLEVLGMEDKEVILDEEIKIYPIDLTKEECVRKSLINRAEIKKQKIDIELSQENIAIIGSANKPVLSLGGNYNWTGTGENFRNSIEKLPNKAWDLFTKVSFPFFDSWATKNKVKLATLEYQRTEDMLKRLKKDIKREVEEFYDDLKRQQKRLELLSENLKLADEALKISQLKYEMGIASVRDVMETQVSYSEVKRTVQNVKVDYIIGKARLYMAMEVLNVEYIQ